MGAGRLKAPRLTVRQLACFVVDRVAGSGKEVHAGLCI